MLSSSNISSAKDELGKVFQMATEGIEIEMFSPAIDAVWHQLLVDGLAYETFSLAACGAVVGHNQGFGKGVVGFIESYEHRWGKLPEIWFMDANGKLNESIKIEYLATGTVQASWNCGATHNCMLPFKNDPRPDRTKDEQDKAPPEANTPEAEPHPTEQIKDTSKVSSQKNASEHV